MRRQHKQKHRSPLRNYGVDLVAWGGIEPPTQGFSDSDNRAKPVVQLAFLLTSVFGV